MALSPAYVRIAPGLLAGLAACAPAEAAPEVSYQGIETRMLDATLVEFRLSLKGAADDGAVRDYAACAAARYALIHDHGYARPIRMTTARRFGTWQADAVYMISRERPAGGSAVAARARVDACAAKGIPTV